MGNVIETFVNCDCSPTSGSPRSGLQTWGLLKRGRAAYQKGSYPSPPQFTNISIRFQLVPLLYGSHAQHVERCGVGYSPATPLN